MEHERELNRHPLIQHAQYELSCCLEHTFVLCSLLQSSYLFQTTIAMTMPASNSNHNYNNNPDLSFCILWSPLPPITWILPFIGHTGIADSRGIANDFQGSYYVATNGQDGLMAFGRATRYLKIDVSDLPGGVERWDESIREANQVYNSRIHNICCDNCHSHVCNALNRMPLKAYGITKWDMVKLCFLIFFRARFLSLGGVLYQFFPVLVLILIITFTYV